MLAAPAQPSASADQRQRRPAPAQVTPAQISVLAAPAQPSARLAQRTAQPSARSAQRQRNPSAGLPAQPSAAAQPSASAEPTLQLRTGFCVPVEFHKHHHKAKLRADHLCLCCLFNYLCVFLPDQPARHRADPSPAQASASSGQRTAQPSARSAQRQRSPSADLPAQASAQRSPGPAQPSAAALSASAEFCAGRASAGFCAGRILCWC